MYTATITQKGQFTLPKDLRQYLGVKSYDKISLKKTKTGVHIEAIPDLLDLAGKYTLKKPKSALKAREYMETHYERA